MTRINVIPVSELSDQHLIAEYHELPRVIKQNINIKNAPSDYVLGAGHMRWAALHWKFTCNRFDELCQEMKYRGFSVQYDSASLLERATHLCNNDGEYCVTLRDLEINRIRIREKYNKKPNFYRWTKRNQPDWLNQKSTL